MHPNLPAEERRRARLQAGGMAALDWPDWQERVSTRGQGTVWNTGAHSLLYTPLFTS